MGSARSEILAQNRQNPLHVYNKNLILAELPVSKPPPDVAHKRLNLRQFRNVSAANS
jgi:hypothetical protein